MPRKKCNDNLEEVKKRGERLAEMETDRINKLINNNSEGYITDEEKKTG